MRDKEEGSQRAAKLRWKAEEIAQSEGAPPAAEPGLPSSAEARQTIHELLVHQIELKMQNEELCRVQADLDSARSHYFDLFDLAPVGYCVLSLEGIILEANLTAVTLLGMARSTLIKQPITRFILKEDQDVYYLHRKQMYDSRAPHVCELRMVRMDGTTFWVRLSASPPALVKGAHSAAATRLVLVDITERKQAEAETAILLAELRRAKAANSSASPAGSGDDRLDGASAKTKAP